MYTIKLNEIEHSNLTDKMKLFNTIMSDEGVEFRYKLDDRLKERGISVRKFAKLTGIRVSSLSDLIHGKKSAWNLHQIVFIMFYLGITDINDLLEIYIPKELQKKLKTQGIEWETYKQIPLMLNVFNSSLEAKVQLLEDE